MVRGERCGEDDTGECWERLQGRMTQARAERGAGGAQARVREEVWEGYLRRR